MYFRVSGHVSQAHTPFHGCLKKIATLEIEKWSIFIWSLIQIFVTNPRYLLLLPTISYCCCCCCCAAGRAL